MGEDSKSKKKQESPSTLDFLSENVGAFFINVNIIECLAYVFLFFARISVGNIIITERHLRCAKSISNFDNLSRPSWLGWRQLGVHLFVCCCFVDAAVVPLLESVVQRRHGTAAVAHESCTSRRKARDGGKPSVALESLAASDGSYEYSPWLIG